MDPKIIREYDTLIASEASTLTKSMETLSIYIYILLVHMYVHSGPRGAHTQRANVWPAG